MSITRLWKDKGALCFLTISLFSNWDQLCKEKAHALELEHREEVYYSPVPHMRFSRDPGSDQGVDVEVPGSTLPLHLGFGLWKLQSAEAGGALAECLAVCLTGGLVKSMCCLGVCEIGCSLIYRILRCFCE